MRWYRYGRVGRRRTFYLDASDGNNASTGLSPGQAWQTIAKVNAASFRPGDRVLLKRGETWAGTCLTVPSDGLSIGAYGSGAKPIIDGQDTQNCVYAIGKSNLRLANLELTQGIDHGAKFDGCTNVAIVDCDMHEAGNDNLIFINGCSSCTVLRGTYYNGYQRVVGYLVTGIEISDGGADFVIDGAEVYGNFHCGISVHNHNAIDPQGATNVPDNVVIRNVHAHNNGTIGINLMNNEASAAVSITVDSCRCESNTQDGIRIGPSGSAITDAEYMHGSIVVSNCSSKSNTRYPIYASADNVTLKRDVFAGHGSYLVGCVDPRVYNCTFYNRTAAAAALYFQLARSSGCVGRNNIVQCDVAGQLIIVVQTGAGVTGWDWDRCLYRRSAGTPLLNHWHWLGTAMPFAGWQSTTGGDANSPTPADAAFTDPTTFDLTLQDSSPAIDAGVAIAGVTEGYLGTAPDLGYSERA